MATYAEYRAAQKVVNNYRREALENVKEYVRSGKSALGNVIVNGNSPMPEGGYYLDFSMEIGVREDGTVLVWATAENDETTPFRVPVEVLDGVLV